MASALHWREKIAFHGLFYAASLAVVLNLQLLVGVTVQTWDVPVTYLLYVIGVGVVRAAQHKVFDARLVALAVGIPLFASLLLVGVGRLYDTTWDGQDYQQSAVVALAQGWNPWHTDRLPFDASSGTSYAVGYPKTTWLLQSAIFKTIGTLQAGAGLSLLALMVAAVLVYGALRRLEIAHIWAHVITGLVVVQVTFVQQVATFMSDGLSYELSVAAIASLVLLVKTRQQIALAAVLACALLLVGTKYSNAIVAGILLVCVGVYLIRNHVYRQPRVIGLVLAFGVAAAVLWWVPYGTNTLRHGSPIYPQNLASERQKLRTDNVPHNLAGASSPALLFYGLFGAAQPGSAGAAGSPDNTAHLKLPFTFRWYEVQPTGRIGAAGVLYSGTLVLAVILYLVQLRRPSTRTPMLYGTLGVSAVILGMALLTPVPNMLRYTPLLSLLPIVALIVTQQNARALRFLLAACLVINIALPVVVTAYLRLDAAHRITMQLSAMRQAHMTYQVDATHFYANYIRLQEAGVPFVMTTQLDCATKQVFLYSYGTTLFCP